MPLGIITWRQKEYLCSIFLFVFVLDGGSLLQRLPWTQGTTYGDICTTYVDYVTKKYREAVVVFDGYEKSSTKDLVHLRRTKGCSGVAVSFTKDTKLSMKKEKRENHHYNCDEQMYNK